MSYSQNDPQWKNTKIGFDTGPTDTIGNYGCYMTAIANVCAWTGNNLNPSQINDLCKQNNWLVSSDLVSNDSVPALLCNNLQFIGKTMWRDATSMNFFDDASDPNITYIICIDSSLSPGIQTHYVMVWATLGNGDLEIEDSWDGVRKSLSHYGNPSVIIQSATKFVKVGESQATLPYTVQPCTPYKAWMIHETTDWHLKYTDWAAMNANAVGQRPAGETVMVVAKTVGHPLGEFWLYDVNAPAGFLSTDMTTTEPAPPLPPVPPTPPSAPLPVKPAEKYTLVTTVKTYGSAVNAQMDTNAQTTLKPGSYYVWGKEDRVYQLGPDNQHQPIGNWILLKDNATVAPVKITPPPVQQPALLPSEVKVGTENDTAWKSSYKPFYPDGRADRYKALQDITFLDYSGKRGKDTIPAGQELSIPGTFVKDGVTFYRPRSGRDEFFSWYYGIAVFDDYGKPNLVKVTSALQDMETTLSDLPRMWIQDIKQLFKKGK